MKTDTQTKILLMDDHAIMRKGLQLLLGRQDDFLIVGEAGDGETGIALIEELSPDIVIMDISMPGLNGIEATKRIVADYPEIKVVALSIHSEKTYVQDMLHAGAAGYILKESVPEDLVRGIREVMTGSHYLSPSITGLVLSGFRDSLSPDKSLPETGRGIIETKLHIPQLPEDHVHRQRLVNTLEASRNLPLQTVTAPAGYGKSSLVSCWLREHELPHSWISLDERENDLHQFITYFVHAIQVLFPRAMPRSLEMLKAANLPPSQILATMLVNELSEIERDFILVMDDFHYISDKRVSDLLAEMLRHPPKSMHLVLVGRTESFLPVGKLRAQRLISEIRLQELRFTEEETADYLQRMLTKNFDPTSSSKLNKKTEGWITGIRLAALSILHRYDTVSLIDELEKSGQYVMDYLFNEVLSNQPENMRRHLMYASIFQRFCAPLLEAVCNWQRKESDSRGWEFITWLKQNLLFLIPLDSDGYWYRFHHLFQELLEKQLRRHYDIDEITTLHTKAGAWFADQGLIEEAIRHMLAAGDLDGAVQLVELNRQTFQNNDQWYILEKWLSMFPETVIQQYPELLAVRTWILYHHFDVPAIPAILEIIEQQIGDVTAKQSLLGEVDFFKGYILYFQNDGMRSLQHLQDALNRIPEEHEEVRGQTEILYGLAHQMLGNKDQAIIRLHDLIIANQMNMGAAKTRLLVAPVYMHIISGDLPEARTANKQLHDFANTHGYLYAELWSFYLDALICFYQYDLDRAIVYFRRALENKYILHTRATVDSLVGLMVAYQLSNQPDMASAVTQELSEYTSGLKDPVYTTIDRLSQTRLSILQGQLDVGVNWHQLVASAAENMVWWLEIPRISYCRALLADGTQISLEDAEDSLLKILQQNEANHNVCQTLQVMPLLTLVHMKQGKADEAKKTLERAVNLAEKGGWTQPFIELGPVMKSLLLELQRQNDSSRFVNQLVAVFEDQSHNRAAEDDDAERSAPLQTDSSVVLEVLTSREQEILKLLAQGHANKEIGERLFVSIETVKTHLRNIYSKLEVKSRLQAVAKAKVSGFLENGDGDADT